MYAPAYMLAASVQVLFSVGDCNAGAALPARGRHPDRDKAGPAQGLPTGGHFWAPSAPVTFELLWHATEIHCSRVYRPLLTLADAATLLSVTDENQSTSKVSSSASHCG